MERGAKGDKRAAEELVRLLTWRSGAGDYPWRTRAAAALGAMHEERAIKPLTEVFLKMAADARVPAQTELFQIGTENVAGGRKDNSVADILTVAKALAAFGPTAAEPLATALRCSPKAPGWDSILEQLAGLGTIAMPHLVGLLMQSDKPSRKTVRKAIETFGPWIAGPILNEVIPQLPLEDRLWALDLLASPEYLEVQKARDLEQRARELDRLMDQAFRDVHSAKSDVWGPARMLSTFGTMALEPLLRRFDENTRSPLYERLGKNNPNLDETRLAVEALRLIIQSSGRGMEREFLDRVARLNPPKCMVVETKTVSRYWSDNGIYFYTEDVDEITGSRDLDISQLVNAAQAELICRQLLSLQAAERDDSLLQRLVPLGNDERVTEMLLEAYALAPCKPLAIHPLTREEIPDRASKEYYLGLLVEVNSTSAPDLLLQEYSRLHGRAIPVEHGLGSQVDEHGRVLHLESTEMRSLKLTHNCLKKLLTVGAARFPVDTLNRLQALEGMISAEFEYQTAYDTKSESYGAVRLMTAVADEVGFADIRDMATQELKRRELAQQPISKAPYNLPSDAGAVSQPLRGDGPGEESGAEFFWP